MLLSESPRLPFQPQRKGHPTHRHEADISHDCFPFEKFSRLLIIRLQVCLFKGQRAAASCAARVGGGGGEERVRRGKGGRKEGINDDGWKALLPALQELSQAGKGAFFTFFVWNKWTPSTFSPSIVTVAAATTSHGLVWKVFSILYQQMQC